MESRDDEKPPATPSTLHETSLEADQSRNKETPVQADIHSTGSRASTIRPGEDSGLEEEERDVEHGSRQLSRVETPRRDAVKVPRSQRRGLFARFALVAEVTEPVDYNRTLKWFITFIVAFAAAAAPVGSGTIFPSLNEVARDLHSTATITNLSVALYMLSMAIFPLWWSAFSEISGRRTVYLTSFALFVVFTALSAVSNTMAMLIAMRMLAGGAAASVQAVGAGTIADIWEPRERGRAMGIFYLGPLCGPLFAPIIGGVVAEVWNWRATQWVLMIDGIITWIFIFIALPETLKVRRAVEEVALADPGVVVDSTSQPALSRRSTREKVHMRTQTYAKMARVMLLDPLKIILYLRFPAVLLTVYYASVTFGSLYVLNISITYTFEKSPYEFKTIITGLLYIPNSIGYITASVFGGRWMDKIMAREAIKANRIGEDGKLIYRPEDRMRENAWLGAVVYPVALIWYGWTTEKGVFWVVPMIANFFYGVGSMLIFAMATTMLTEFMPRKSSNGVAVNNFVRNIFSCVGGIVGAPLIHAIGNGWLFTILGLWALSSSVVIWAMKRYGPKWRVNMEKQMT